MLRMLLIGYLFAIRSERALCREVRVNLAYRWFCGLSIEDKIPDHSAFCRARNERFRDSDLFRRVFERVVEDCMAAGLVGGEGFAVDASLIAADANIGGRGVLEILTALTLQQAQRTCQLGFPYRPRAGLWTMGGGGRAESRVGAMKLSYRFAAASEDGGSAAGTS